MFKKSFVGLIFLLVLILNIVSTVNAYNPPEHLHVDAEPGGFFNIKIPRVCGLDTEMANYDIDRLKFLQKEESDTETIYRFKTKEICGDTYIQIESLPSFGSKCNSEPYYYFIKVHIAIKHLLN